MIRLFFCAISAAILAMPLFAQSYYPLRPNDSLAAYLEKGNFGVHADGVTDDSDALQQAINRVEETTHQGVVMAGGTWRPMLQSSQLAPFAVGDRRYITSEDDARTYSTKLGEGGTLINRVFAERGGTSVVSDDAGNVYLASGQVYIYDRDGKEIGVLEVPERPSSLAFGGTDHRTLFIGARSSLYAIRLAATSK